MRNLKKVLAVILTVAMLASFMVPAFAAVSYLEEAKKLQAIGLFAGGEADLKLDEDVTRIQGLTFAIRAAGKEEEALAMTDEEVAAELAKFKDSDTVPSWNGNGPKYVAYAIKNGITVGDGQGNFKPLDKISGRAFLVFLLKTGMGYKDVTTLTAPDVAVEAGILKPSQAMAYAAAESGIIRDDAAAILYGAALNGVNADGKKFIEALIESGFVSEEDAIEAGFVEAKPDTLEVEGVKTTNLIQVVVELNSTNYDEEELKNKDNYEITGVAANGNKKTFDIDNISVDGTEVTITLKEAAANQSDATIVIDKAITGKEVELDFEFFDNKIPEVKDVKVIGEDTVKVIFSEPMKDLANSKGEFDIDAGKKSYSIASVTPVNNGYEANVEVYGKFTEGTLTVKVGKGIEDYAGFNVISKTFEIEVVEDEEAPEVVGYQDATRDKVTLIFSEDIKFVSSNPDKANFYHTNSNNTVDVESGKAKVEIDGNKLTLHFGTNKLPEGTAYVYVKSGTVQDYWYNKNDTVRIKVSVEVDETAPEVKDVKLSETELKVYFTEKVDRNSAEDLANYKLTNEDGDKISLRSAAYTYNESKKESLVTIQLRSKISTGTYRLEVSGVEDAAGNKMEKYTTELEISDTQAPQFAKDGGVPAAFVKVVKTNEEYEIYIQLDEAVATEGKYDATDLYKYELGDVNLGKANADGDYSVDLKVINEGKTIKLVVKKDSKNVALTIETTKLIVGRLADVHGNYTALSTELKTVPLSNYTIGIKEATATAKDTVKVKFEGSFDKFELDDFIVTDDAATTPAVFEVKSIDVVNSDEIVLELRDSLPANTNGIYVKTVANAGDIGTENSYGAQLKANLKVDIKDKIAPSLITDDDVDTKLPYKNSGSEDGVARVYATYYRGANEADGYSIITIEFDEDLEYVNNNLGLFKVNDGDNEVTAVTEGIDGKIQVKVKGEVLRGDEVFITVVFDTNGNRVDDLTLKIEYLVDIDTLTP